MRKVVLVVGSAVALAAAGFAFPVTAVAAMAVAPIHGPRAPGPHSGAISPQAPAPPRRAPAIRAPSASAPVPCDQGFDLVASPNTANYNYMVATAVISANDAWAVGNTFNPAISTGGDTTLAEHWDGTTWTIVPTPNPGPYRNDLTGVTAIASNDVWAVGYYQVDAQGDFHTFAEHWNGSGWIQLLTTANPSTIFSLLFAVTALSSGDIWAVGTYDLSGNLVPMAQHWDGSHWNNVFVPNPAGTMSQLFSVSAWGTHDVWAIGSDNPFAPMPPFQSLAEHYDGVRWTLQTTGNLAGDNEILAVVALEANHAEGVGYGGFVAMVSMRQSAGWDLTTGGPGPVTNLGTALPISGTGDNALLSVDRSGDSLWAGGYMRATLTGPRASLAVPAVWDATIHTLTWHMVGLSADPSGFNNVFLAISAVSPSVFWGVGYETSISAVDQTFAAMECALHFQLGAPATVKTGSAFSLTVTALNGSGLTATDYVGIIHFTSNDPPATLPANYTFVAGDAGTHTFAGVVLRTPYQRTITAADTVTPFIAASITISAHCPGACQSTAVPPGGRGVPNPGGHGPPHGRTPAQSAAASINLRLARRFSWSGGAEPALAARSREVSPRLL